MKSLRTHNFTAYVGLDWADTKHDICLQEAGSEQREFACVAHQVECIDEWAKSLQQRFGGPIAIALELAKGPIVYALQKYDFLVLFPINPLTLAKYREAFRPSRAKDDPSDAELALDLLVRHPERFAPLQPQSVGMRTLISLTERRRELINDKTRVTNRLTNTLKQYYPQALEWFDQHDTVMFCDFLSRWPTPLQAKRAHRASIKAFHHAHNAHRPKLIAERLAAIKAAVPRRSPTTGSLRGYLELGPTWHPGYWWPSEKIASASSGPRSYKNTLALPLLPNAAAKRTGSIGAGSVQPSCVRPSSNGPARRSINPSGLGPTTTSNVPRAVPTKPPCVRWPSSGSASSTAAGRVGSPMTKANISRP